MVTTLLSNALILSKAPAKSSTKILKKLEDIPYFKLDKVIVFIKSIFEQYPDHCNHKLFVLITRAVGNLALKRIWTTVIKYKLEFPEYENIKETELQHKACSSQEFLKLKKFCKELDEEGKEVIDITETLPEK